MELKFLILICVTIFSVTAVKNYEGYKVYKVSVKSAEELEVLKELQKNSLGEFWEDQFDVGHVVKVMVAPEKLAALLKVLNESNIEVTEVIGDLQKAIQDQLKTANIRSSESLFSLTWDRYYNLDEIYAWLDEIVAAYPDVVRSVEIGRSVENRPIKGIVINFKANEHDRVGMIEGTLHAREWISAATVTWIIKEFLTSTDPEIRSIADNFEWHIFPVVNPDGYSYTFTHNRMWRKNRSTANFKVCADADDDMSNGVDLNRNFDYMWMYVGASDDSCSNTYAGPNPASEPETEAIKDYVLSLNNTNLIYYIAFHSYTQLILVPYSHLPIRTQVGRPRNFGDMYEIAIRGSDAMAKRFGSTYQVGLSSEVMYAMSGTSFDWVKYEVDVPITYLIELRDLGEYGFLLPPEHIAPTGIEIMDAFKGMDQTARFLKYYEISDNSSSATNVVYSMTIVLLGVIFAMF